MKTLTRISTTTAIAAGIATVGVLASGPAMATESTKPAVSGKVQEAAQQQLSPEQIENVKTIIQVGKDNDIPRQGIKIALVTAQQESTLLNLDYGDRDSLGLFQKRPSAGWGSPEQIKDPVFAAKSFYGVNPEVSPNGLLQIQGWENMAPGDAAQAVQVSAFPDAYAKWDGMAEDLLNQYY